MKKKLIKTSAVLFAIALGLVIHSMYLESLRSIRFEKPSPTPRPQSYDIVDVLDEKISIIALIANPEKYQGKRIRIKGVANLQFETNFLFVSKDDHRNWVMKNALWIELPEDTPEDTINKLKRLNGRYVEIEGFFDAETGHGGAGSGRIRNIQSYVPTF